MKSYYDDNRPRPTRRLIVRDHGIVLPYGTGPLECDYLGARDVWVFEQDGKYYMHYDGAGPKGWLACLAVSDNLTEWKPLGPVLNFGPPGSVDSGSASYGTTFFDGERWHMFYLGTPNTTPAPDFVPSFPYQTLKATADSPAGPWTKAFDLRPWVTTPDSFCESSASPGQVLKLPDGQYIQYIAVSTGEFGQASVKRSLAIVRTRNLDGEWTLDPGPMLPLTEQIENSTIYFEESTGLYYLFTNHVGYRQGIEACDAIWVYWSKDPEKWRVEDKAIALDYEYCTVSKEIIGLPSVVRRGNQLALFYDSLDQPALDNLSSHMRRHICLAWIDCAKPLIEQLVPVET
jgi:hypothetical protein